MTKIVICGANGKMGHTVASCIDGRDDCTVIGGVDSYTAKYADFPIVATPAELPEVPDVIIDLSVHTGRIAGIRTGQQCCTGAGNHWL